MKLKPLIALIAVVGSALTLSVAGCGDQGSHAQKEVDTRSANVAPSDFNPDAKSNAKERAKTEGETVSADSNKVEKNSIVDKGGEGSDFAEREEIRRSYTLKPDADVVVSGFHGRVDVETVDTDHAELLIVRSARRPEDLQFRKIKIEHDPSELRISVENDQRSFFSALSSRREGRQRVMLKLPRKVKLETSSVNGDVAIGEIDGGLDVHDVNGKINIAQATGGVSFHRINGRIDATVAKLSTGSEIDINGVNGNATLRFIGEVNADVEANGNNGRVESDLPNYQENKDERRYGRYSAHIGSGGPQIEIHSVNGNIFLTKAEKQGATTAKK